MRVSGLHHVAIEARDVERVAAFFRDALGLPEVTRHLRPDGSLRSVWLGASSDHQPGGPFIAVEASAQGARAGAGWFMVALGIAPEDRPKVVLALRARGVAIEKETRWTVYVRDPEGNLVGLSHYPRDQAAPGRAP